MLPEGPGGKKGTLHQARRGTIPNLGTGAFWRSCAGLQRHSQTQRTARRFQGTPPPRGRERLQRYHRCVEAANWRGKGEGCEGEGRGGPVSVTRNALATHLVFGRTIALCDEHGPWICDDWHLPFAHRCHYFRKKKSSWHVTLRHIFKRVCWHLTQWHRLWNMDIKSKHSIRD